jgi:hypothetical protein
MANTSRVNGFKPVKHTNGSPYNGQCNIYEVAAANDTPIYIGDAVVRSTDASASGYVTVKSLSGNASAANDVTAGVVVGVVVGILNAKMNPDGKMTAGSIALDTPQSVPVSTAAFVLVCDAIDVIYEVQSTASYALADIGLNADVGVLAVAGNGAVTGNSGMYVNATAPTASASRPVHVIGYSKRMDNEQVSANNKLLVHFTTHAQGNAIVGV